MKNYILNLETNKIELHFSKEEYQALPEQLKKELKSSFLFSGKSQAWVSRSSNNHYSAIRTAKKLGFEGEERQGERLSFAEELERKAEKAEARIERYEEYAANAEKRAEGLQKEFNELRKDWSYVTQPIIRGHAGSEAFANRRHRIMDRYNKGFEEYRKSDYYKERATTAQETADMKQFKDPVYLNNRIKECNKNMKAYESHIVKYEDLIYKKENKAEIEGYYNTKTIEEIQKWLNDTVDKMEYEIDKLAYLENCMEEVNKARQQEGRKIYTKEDLKIGYEVKIRGTWETVLKINKTTVEVQPIEERIKMFVMKYPFAEIQDLRIPENWSEPKNELENPYNEGDILVSYNISGNRIISAYQVLKVTAKSVQVQEINIDSENKPIKDGFKINSKPERKGITKSKYSDFVGCYNGDWQLHKYTA